MTTPPVLQFYGRSAKELAGGSGTAFIANSALCFHDGDKDLSVPNIPASATQWLGPRWFDATAFDAARVVITVAAPSPGDEEAVIQYSQTPWDVSSWVTAGETEDILQLLSVGGIDKGRWVALDTPARADAAWRLVLRGGNGSGDATVNYAGIEFGRQGHPPTVLVPWYLRRLNSSADLSATSESAKITGDAILINPASESLPRQAFIPADTDIWVSGSGASTLDPIATTYQLKQQKASGVNSARLVSVPTDDPTTQWNWATMNGRFATPALQMQDVRRFTARLHHRRFRTTSVGHMYLNAWLMQWRPGVGIVRAYAATVGRVDATLITGLGPASTGSPLEIDVTDVLQILLGDRIVLEIQQTTIEDSLASETNFVFDGGVDNPSDGGVDFENMAARIDMPDFATVPGSD